MERIQVNVRIPEEVKEFERKQLAALQRTPFIQEYLAKHGMTEEDLKENLPFFLQMAEEIQECKNCKGLAYCVKKERGYVPTLKKLGFVQWVKTPCHYLKEEWEKQEKQKFYRHKLIPQSWQQIHFADIELQKESKDYLLLLKRITDWADHPQGKGFYLYGAPGVGKTYLMLCLLNQRVAEGKTAAFVNVLDLISHNKTRIDFEAMREIIEADFAVFDDIGAETVNALSRDEILFTILDARMNQHKSTCFTSNFSMEMLEIHFIKNQYGDEEPMKAKRLMERIRALAEEVEMGGKSRR